MKYILTNREQLTQDTIRVTLHPAEEHLSFRAGQYVSLRFKRRGRMTPARCFSVTCYPNQEGIVELGIKVEGKFTRALNNLPLNSEIDVDGPFGEFMLDPQFDASSVMLAAGIGITPMMSLLRTATAHKLNNPFVLLYSVKSMQDAAYAPELLELEARNSNLRVIFVMSRTTEITDAKHQMTGHVTAELIGRAARNDFANTSFFVCGPVNYLNGMVAILRQAGTPEVRINTEAFVQARSTKSSSWFSAIRQQLTSSYAIGAASLVALAGVIGVLDMRANQAKAAAKAAAAQAAETVTNPEETTDDAITETVPTTDTTTTTQTTPTPDTTPTTTPTTTTPTQTQPTFTTPSRSNNGPISSVS